MRRAFALAVPPALAAIALSTERAEATTRGPSFYAYVRIEGSKPGAASPVVSIKPSAIALSTPSAGAAAAHVIPPRALAYETPAPSSTAEAVQEPCGKIVLLFAPTGEASVAGTLETDSHPGCLFVVPMARDAAQAGQLGWHVKTSGTDGGLQLGQKSHGTVHPFGAVVTLHPGQTTVVAIGYDPNTNTFVVWPR